MKDTVPWILVCEDDDDDYLLLSRALETAGYPLQLVRAMDGEGVLPALNGAFSSDGGCTLPCFVLMDLRMPRKDGRAALREIKQHREFRKVPVVVLTTSKYHGDVEKAYEEGANTFFTKPQDFKSLQALMKLVCDYWFAAARPCGEERGTAQTGGEERK